VDENYIRLRANGCIYTGLSTPPVRGSFLLSAKRDAAAAERFLAKTLGASQAAGAAGDEPDRPLWLFFHGVTEYPEEFVLLGARTKRNRFAS
jgi:hypothetical protein